MSRYRWSDIKKRFVRNKTFIFWVIFTFYIFYVFMCMLISRFFYFYQKDDLSHHKSATQTPIYSGESVPLYEAKNALDRNPTTCIRTENIGPNSPYKIVGGKWILVEFTESTASTSCLNYTLVMVVIFLLDSLKLISLHICKEVLVSTAHRP